MDTFDVRKYITENRINEAPFRNKVDSLLAYYEAETGNEPGEGVKDEIVHLLGKGYSTDDVKPIIIDIEPLKEEKDVIEPDPQVVDGEERAKEIEDEAAAEEEDDNMPEVTVDLKYIEDRLAKPLKSAIEEDIFELIDKNNFLRTIKAVMKNSFYENEFLSEFSSDNNAVGGTLARILQVYSQKFLPELEYDIEKHKPYIEEFKEILDFGGSYTDFSKSLNDLKRDGWIFDSSTGDFEPVNNKE